MVNESTTVWKGFASLTDDATSSYQFVLYVGRTQNLQYYGYQSLHAIQICTFGVEIKRRSN
jgi:hypothetical protein